MYPFNASVSKIETLGIPGAQGFANASDYACGSSYGCALVPASYCNNNLPSQYACVDSAYANAYLSLYNSGKANQTAICPMFFLAGSPGCECLHGYCALTYSRGALGVAT